MLAKEPCAWWMVFAGSGRSGLGVEVNEDVITQYRLDNNMLATNLADSIYASSRRRICTPPLCRIRSIS